jgi:hypothetical protein
MEIKQADGNGAMIPEQVFEKTKEKFQMYWSMEILGGMIWHCDSPLILKKNNANTLQVKILLNPSNPSTTEQGLSGACRLA